MLFKSVGKEPNFFFAPLWLFDVIIDSLQWVADTFNSEKFENAAELGRIGKYYAVEDMLTTDPSEKFGTITLQEHYDRIAVEGQEYDPYTTMYVSELSRLYCGSTSIYIPIASLFLTFLSDRKCLFGFYDSQSPLLQVRESASVRIKKHIVRPSVYSYLNLRSIYRMYLRNDHRYTPLSS